MKIILNCGDKINIPDGCTAEIKDGVITIEKEKIRWIAEKDENFFFVGIYGEVVMHRSCEQGEKLWREYNYFRTKEQAEKAAELVKATLRKFHEDYGSNK